MRLPRRLRIALVVVLALVTMAAGGTSIGRYLARGAWEEAKILWRRRAIADLLADSTTPRSVARRLQLVVDAREFAVRTLGLKAGDSFTTYSALKRDTLVLVLSAARRDTLAQVTWSFPVVGRVPYKGFFDFDEAIAQRERLRAQGYATNLRPAAAFSTLGWFNDPLLTTTLKLDTLDLANTVIHELLHNTIFVKGEVAFNESFASFVGARGAQAFFESRTQHAASTRVAMEWEDEKRLAEFWERVVRDIERLFDQPGRDSAMRAAAGDSAYRALRQVLRDSVAPQMPTAYLPGLERMPLDNAALLARRVYAKELPLFDEIHQRLGAELRRTIDTVRVVVERDHSRDPYVALREWLRALGPESIAHDSAEVHRR